MRGQAEKVKDLVRRLRNDEVPHDVAEIFAELGTWPFARTADRVLSREPVHEQATSVPNSGAASIARRFHEDCGTLTHDVDASIRSLESGTRAIRVGHQPNFAGYLKLVSLLVAVAEVARNRNEIPVYLVNDCDVVANQRFARSQIPEVNHPRGFRYLNLPKWKTDTSRLAFSAPRPSSDWLDEVVKAIRENAESESRLLPVNPSDAAVSSDAVVEDLRHAWESSQTLAELATCFLSRLVNIRMDTRVVFVSGFEVWRRTGGPLTHFLLEHWEDVKEAHSAGPPPDRLRPPPSRPRRSPSPGR